MVKLVSLAARLKNFKISGQTMSWTVSNITAEKRLSVYLYEEVYFSNRLIKLAKSSDALLTVNGKHRTVRYQITDGDHIAIRFPFEANDTSLKATELPLDIIYEDDHLMVLNKESGIATVPSVKQRETSLANGIFYYYQLNELPYTVHIVTRLDRDTSGLVLVAKHQYAHSLLANLQLTGEINRVYVGLIEGHLPNNAGTINYPIGRRVDSIIEREVSKAGQKAITHYKVLEEFEDYSYVLMTLETGRTHQIRVHFSYLGYPLVGDDLYGETSKYIKRQALHCKTLKFTHPITQKRLQIDAFLPNDFAKLVEK